MRVLHLDTGTGWRGGQQQLFWLLEGARARGLDQLLLVPSGSVLAERARRVGFALAEISPRILSWENLWLLRDRAPEFHILHAHDARAHSLAFAPRLLTARGGPRVVVSRRVGFAIPGYGQLKYRSPDMFIAVSNHVRHRLLQAGVPEHKIRVIYDGVKAPECGASLSAASQRLRRARHAEEGVFLMGTLATPAPEKRIDILLDVLAEVPPPVHFWLGLPAEARHTPAVKELEQQAARRGLAERFAVVPLGETSGHDASFEAAPAKSGSVESEGEGAVVADVFVSALDLFVYLSEMEGLGSAILLAMAHALPVLASAAGGIPEIVRHHQTGLLVEGDPRTELPNAIRLLRNSPALRARLGAAARRFVLENASVDLMTERTIALYRELMEGSRPQA